MSFWNEKVVCYNKMYNKLKLLIIWKLENIPGLLNNSLWNTNTNEKKPGQNKGPIVKFVFSAIID